jgi:radical SAM protein with 4Fe4S-binding SPASM domain
MGNHSPLILGNIRETHFRRLVRSRAARTYASVVPQECAECGMADVCRGNCKACAEQAYGDASVLEPFVAANATQRILPRQ